MRQVKQATLKPGNCAVTKRSNGPFIDFEVESQTFEERLYLAETVVRKAASELLRMHDDYDYQELVKALAEVHVQLEESQREAEHQKLRAEEAERDLEAFDRLERKSQQAARKPRPRNTPNPET